MKHCTKFNAKQNPVFGVKNTNMVFKISIGNLKFSGDLDNNDDRRKAGALIAAYRHHNLTDVGKKIAKMSGTAATTYSHYLPSLINQGKGNFTKKMLERLAYTYGIRLKLRPKEQK